MIIGMKRPFSWGGWPWHQIQMDLWLCTTCQIVKFSLFLQSLQFCMLCLIKFSCSWANGLTANFIQNSYRREHCIRSEWYTEALDVYVLSGIQKL